jgi:hypothetical protein
VGVREDFRLILAVSVPMAVVLVAEPEPPPTVCGQTCSCAHSSVRGANGFTPQLTPRMPVVAAP